jgi:hypothetical protein
VAQDSLGLHLSLFVFEYQNQGQGTPLLSVWSVGSVTRVQFWVQHTSTAASSRPQLTTTRPVEGLGTAGPGGLCEELQRFGNWMGQVFGPLRRELEEWVGLRLCNNSAVP